MLKTKIPLFYLVLTTICCSILSVVTYTIVAKNKQNAYAAQAATNEPSSTNTPSCHYNISRLNGYKFIHPVYAAEPDCESSIFLPFKNNVSEFIESMKTSGDLLTASVYLKDLTSEDWSEINPDEQYHPGSLFKVNTMITYLRMAETEPGILNKEVAYNATAEVPVQTFNSKTIMPGHKYKVSELIRYMIIYSDNNATSLLHDFIDISTFQKTFTDLNIKKPDVHDRSYALSVRDYSKFMSVLYDGGYLTMSASEYAISLLSESDFKEGIIKELPANLKVAHKFGESKRENERELHECAIIYLSNRPYLLTIMTRGRDSRKLADIISHISKIAYDHMAAKPV